MLFPFRARRVRRTFNILKQLIIFILISCATLGATAQDVDLLAPFLASAPPVFSQSAVLIDAETGTVLYSKNPNQEIPPASLTKLMTMHLVFNEIASGRISLNSIIPIGQESWALRQPSGSSLMFLAPGQIVTLHEILLGLAVSSGNDAAVAAALAVAPTVADFAGMMTLEARRMGLVSTRFVEPSGISEYNMTTAAEFTAFCREYVRLHGESLANYHSAREFAYPLAHNVQPAYRDNPHTISQNNRNNLLWTVEGVDGLKTGYIIESGYNIALTAQRGHTRFIAALLGAPAELGGTRARDADGTSLLNWAFDNFKTVRPVVPAPENIRLWKGKENEAALRIDGEINFTSPITRADRLWYSVIVNEPLIAPLPANFPVGKLILYDNQGEVRTLPLLTARSYERGNFFKRLWHSIRLMFKR
jgi:D-alanyl-D-alanine carboxypeptidase (penicillin-binding protein 5/6)